MVLIAAIGAQNAFVLRQGLRREHVWPVVMTCAVSDALLIAVGVIGLGTAVAGNPAVVTATRLGGAVFLLTYAGIAARRAMRPGTLRPADGGPATLRTTLLACLAFTFLNPHVYLDTVLLLGTVASQHTQPWIFAVGASLASAAWFTALGGGARRLAPLLAKPAAWRAVDGIVALVMAALGVSLLLAQA